MEFSLRSRAALLVLLVVGCSRRDPVQVEHVGELGESIVKLASQHAKLREQNGKLKADHANIGEEIRQLGYQQAELDMKLLAARDQLTELQQVVVMVECIERKSSLSVKTALQRGDAYLEACRDETLALKPDDLTKAADRLIAQKRKPR